MDLGLNNKIVLVTGSSRGIGLAIARGFLEEGSKVILTSRDKIELDKIKDDLSKTFPSENIFARACDFTLKEEISVLKDWIIETVGELDILVANVGSGKSVSDPIPSYENFERVFRLNFDSVVDTVRGFYPLIKESRGCILFIASIAGIEAFGAPTDYSVAKTGVIAFSKNLARKIASEGVRVNCIAPGNIYFKGGTWEKQMEAEPERIKELIKKTVPMNRFGRPEEIADAALFLCSESASFITGVCLIIDGGQTSTLY